MICDWGPSIIDSINLDWNRVKFYSVREAQVVKESLYNHKWTEQTVFWYIFSLFIQKKNYSLTNLSIISSKSLPLVINFIDTLIGSCSSYWGLYMFPIFGVVYIHLTKDCIGNLQYRYFMFVNPIHPKFFN